MMDLWEARANPYHSRSFYCNRRYGAATSLTAGGLSARSVNILFQVCLPHGSTRPSRLRSRRFRHEPS